MSVPRTVAAVIRQHVTLEVEGIDRMYLNIYQPNLQSEKQGPRRPGQGADDLVGISLERRGPGTQLAFLRRARYLHVASSDRRTCSAKGKVSVPCGRIAASTAKRA
jgi:hypothetical protein